MESQKILYVASTFGHLATFHQPYLRWFSDQGYEVHAAAGGASRPLEGVSRYIALPFKKRMTAWSNWRAAKMLAREMRAEGYALISVHTALAAFFARLAVRRIQNPRPVVINTTHGYLFDDDTQALKRGILLAAEQMTAPQTDYLLTMNIFDDALAHKQHLGKTIIKTDGMGVDFARYPATDQALRQKAREAFLLPADATVLVCAAELSPRKNQRLLIDALEHLPEHVHLLLAGQGDTLDECRAHARQLNLAARVHLVGFVEDIAQCYHAADICVCASRIEGLPFNIMEAMHFKLPVVASAVKGQIDLVQHGITGYLYPYGDSASCARAVQRLLEPKARTAMGDAAHDAVQRYGLDTVFPQLTAIYQQALTHSSVLQIPPPHA